MSGRNILEIHDLHTSFFTDSGVVRAVNGVDLLVPEGKIVGLVGESGCGKSITAKSVMGLVRYPGRIESGSILLDGHELVGLPENELRKLCGFDVSMIFQEPMTSLNPVMRVGHQVEEALRVHSAGLTGGEAKDRVIRMFRKVGIPEPEARFRAYPHELSGGLRQRVMIAMAMIMEPKLLIADEPTTALDVTVEAQILSLMRQLSLETGMSVLIISHNMGVVAELCDEVYVMYAGKIVEKAPVMSLFDGPAHPYTRGLLASIPRMSGNPEYLHTIAGVVPNLNRLPGGCAFHPRCEQARLRCREEMPDLYPVGEGHFSRCFLCAESMHSRLNEV